MTGASSGIGAAVARELGRRGAAVGLLGRRLERLEALAEELRSSGGRAIAVACDVTRDGEVERAASRVRGELGAISLVVANAGFGLSGEVATVGVEGFRRQYETNVFGVIRTVQATVEDLRTARGVLAILGSVAGYFGVRGHAPYCSSKAAVRAIAQSLWAELRPWGVGVVLVSPGYVESEFRRHGEGGELKPDPVPAWLVMPAETAARTIVRAMLRRRQEVVLTLHGRLGVWLARLAPGLLLRLLAPARSKVES